MGDHFRRKMDWAVIGGILSLILTLCGVVWASISWGARVVGKHKGWQIKVDRAIGLEPRVEALEKDRGIENAKLDVILIIMGVDPTKVKVRKEMQ